MSRAARVCAKLRRRPGIDMKDHDRAAYPGMEMPGHHIVPRFVIARWQGEDGRVTLADFDRLAVRSERPQDLEARRGFNRLEFHEDPEALESRFFGALESNAARAFDELITARLPLDHAKHARENRFRPGQLLKGKRAVRFAQFLAAQAVRSPDWRTEANAHTAAALAEELESKVHGDLAAAADPEEIARLKSMLGLRYQAVVQGDVLPQLSAALTTGVGQVFYCEYMPTVVRLPAPMLCLGNDPVVFVDEDPDVGFGSYSQVAARRGTHPFSVRRDAESFMRAAVDVARGHKLVVMPLDPEHAVVLQPAKSLVLPGLYAVGLEFGQLLNSVEMKAGRRWLVVPPGRVEWAREAVYRDSPGLREADRYRAEHGMQRHTDPGRPPDHDATSQQSDPPTESTRRGFGLTDDKRSEQPDSATELEEE